MGDQTGRVVLGFDGSRTDPHARPVLMRQRPDGTVVVVDLAETAARLRTDMLRMLESFRSVARQAIPHLRRLASAITDAANDPVRVAGLEGRYWVRAGLDPQYSTPGGLERLLGQILLGRRDDDLAYLTQANREVVAEAATRGWLASHTPTAAGLARHHPGGPA